MGVLAEVVGDMGTGGVGFPEAGADDGGDGFLVGQGVVVAVGELYGGGVQDQPFFGADDGAGGGDVVAVVGNQLLGEAAEVVVMEDGDVGAFNGFNRVGDDPVEDHVGGIYAEAEPPEGEALDIDARAVDGGREFDRDVVVAVDVGLDVGEHADDGGDEVVVLLIGQAPSVRDLHGGDGEAVVEVEMGGCGDRVEVGV